MQPMAGDRVSPVVKRLGVVVALGAIAGAIWYLQRSPKSRASEAATAPTGPATAAASPSSAPATPPPTSAGPLDKVTKLTLEQRSRLADRIAKAQAARGAVSAPKAPRLPDEAVAEPQLSKTQIRDAMREVIPHLKACYEEVMLSLPDTTTRFTADVLLTGDPDVGTLIDTEAIIDSNGVPLPAKFDDCLRTTFMTIALPPLAEGSRIQVKYPFMFSHTRGSGAAP
jgi:hypothetical protein